MNVNSVFILKYQLPLSIQSEVFTLTLYGIMNFWLRNISVLILLVSTYILIRIRVSRMTEEVSDECEKHKGGWLTG